MEISVMCAFTKIMIVALLTSLNFYSYSMNSNQTHKKKSTDLTATIRTKRAADTDYAGSPALKKPRLNKKLATQQETSHSTQDRVESDAPKSELDTRTTCDKRVESILNKLSTHTCSSDTRILRSRSIPCRTHHCEKLQNGQLSLCQFCNMYDFCDIEKSISASNSQFRLAQAYKSATKQWTNPDRLIGFLRNRSSSFANN